jgi:hypothetical protein
MTLYEIDKNICDLIENGFVVDEETGEILYGADELEQLQEERSAKLEAVALYIKNLEAMAASIKEEENALASRRKAKEARAEKLKSYLTNSIIGNGDKEFESSKVAVSFRKSTAVIVDEEKLDKDYFVEKVTVKNEPDKKRIKADITAGKAVAGAYIEERQNIKIV